LVSDIKGGAQTEGVGEQDAEENTGSKREEMIGGWRKLHSEKPSSLVLFPLV
jgi:hypothetical protein